MDAKSREVLNLAEQVRLSIEADWTTQRAREERTLGYSENNLSRQVKARYPDIKTGQIFKTIYAYTKYNDERDASDPIREFPRWKLEIVLRFLYVDMRTPYGWPSVTKAIKDFENGKYLPLIAPYVADDGIGRIEKILNEELLVQAGASPGQDTITQMLQLTLKLKKEQEATLAANSQLKEENTMLKQKTEERALKINRLREELARMQGAIDARKGDKSSILPQIQRLQNLLDSLI